MTPSDLEKLELWKDIEPAGYRISNFGKVSGKRKDLLRPMITIHGYARVCLRNRGRPKYTSIHSLVAGAFIGPRPQGYSINHKDGDKLNNRVENLEYVTPLENLKHAWANGHKVQGDTHGRRKLNSAAVAEIKALRAQGVPRATVAKRYGVHKTTITRVVNNHSWRILLVPAEGEGKKP